MNLFRAKTADQLEERLMNVVNNFSKTFGLKDEVTTKIENAEGHIKLGTIGGLGIGALGVLGGIASIPLIPAIATTAVVGGFTVAGVAIMAGGAGMVAGLGYAGLGKLYSKYQESRLGGLTSKIFEDHRMGIEDAKFERDFNRKVNHETDYKLSADSNDLYKIKEAVKQGDMLTAQDLVKNIVNKADLKVSTRKEPLFKESISTGLESKLDHFFDAYTNKLNGKENQNKIRSMETKMAAGGILAALGTLGAAAGIVAASSVALATGGIVIGAAALAYSGIQAIKKSGLSQRNSSGFEVDAERHLQKVAKDLNIDAFELDSIKKYRDQKNSSNFKDQFVKETTDRIKQKLN